MNYIQKVISSCKNIDNGAHRTRTSRVIPPDETRHARPTGAASSRTRGARRQVEEAILPSSRMDDWLDAALTSSILLRHLEEHGHVVQEVPREQDPHAEISWLLCSSADATNQRFLLQSRKVSWRPSFIILKIRHCVYGATERTCTRTWTSVRGREYAHTAYCLHGLLVSVNVRPL